jgi:hypothetical protein
MHTHSLVRAPPFSVRLRVGVFNVRDGPAEKWWIGQSMDNQILVYSARDRFRQHPRKQFKGHLSAGYACQPNFSPDGRSVATHPILLQLLRGA